MAQTPINFTEVNSRHFVHAYNNAVKSSRETFTFEGNDFVVTFAYYLIQYLVMHHVVSGAFDNKRLFQVNAVNPNLN